MSAQIRTGTKRYFSDDCEQMYTKCMYNDPIYRLIRGPINRAGSVNWTFAGVVE